MKKKSITYRQSGVDIKKADRFVSFIKKLSNQKQNLKNRSVKVLKSNSGYASLIESGSNQVVAATTDGVGTKLKLAFEVDVHHTVGIDLVAMSVNDLLCVGVKPAFFLDYFATGELALRTSKSVIAGIVKGCEQAGCVLLGGETAEMPGIYSKGEYDLAGFAVGVGHKKQLVVDSGRLKVGTKLIGIESSGFHSNGFSLVRKLLPRHKNRKALIKKLLTPTTIYVDSVWPLIAKGQVLALSHITGSGFLNLPRMDETKSYDITLPAQAGGFSYKWLSQVSSLSLLERAKTFNCGIGMVLAVDPKKVHLVLNYLSKTRHRAFLLGSVINNKSSNVEVHVKQGSERFSLRYDD